MNCPKCDQRCKVLSSRGTDHNYLHRTRLCGCGYRFKTVEIPLNDLMPKTPDEKECTNPAKP